ncbi:hypothetical protein [Lignipirellula cremea]|uniref:Uncharacterized protein n=1 Tax=Lignipirellula cremea TaxID=2528010 RepID=A0A518E0B9_9BACT|nr:hypothetical protein [Lignipirellula cremea]QDU97546.1 hypothetical protein Pla8534_53940 [Lignipirellula cremea]
MIKNCHSCLVPIELPAGRIPVCDQCLTEIDNLPPRPRIEACTRIIESVARERNTDA